MDLANHDQDNNSWLVGSYDGNWMNDNEWFSEQEQYSSLQLGDTRWKTGEDKKNWKDSSTEFNQSENSVSNNWPIRGGKGWKKSNKLKRIIWKFQPIWISSIDQLEKYKTEEHTTNQNESSTEINKSENSSDFEHGPIRTHVQNSE